MSLQRAATDVADLVLRDFAQSPAGGAWCQYLDIQRQNPLTGGLGINSAYERWCEPPGEPPGPPPSQEFQEAGGVACRDYLVTFTTGDSQGNQSTGQSVQKGPIRLVRSDTSVNGIPRTRFYLQGGDGVGCPSVQGTIAGSDNTNVIEVFARIDSIVAIGGPFPDEEPVPVPPTTFPPPAQEPFEVNLDVDIGPFNIEVPVTFGPVIFNTFGAFVPVSIRPTADFNVPINLDVNPDIRFGIDLDLEVVVPIGGGPTGSDPIPGTEPIPIPGRDRILETECEEVDYERIQKIVEDAACCKPATNFQSLGTFTFETANSVFNIPLPSNTVIVFIAVIPDNDTRVYKLAGANAEYAHGNASITTSGDALDFVRIYVNNHALTVPFELADKGLRLSLKRGTIATVTAGLFVPVEEV